MHGPIANWSLEGYQLSLARVGVSKLDGSSSQN